MTRSRRAAHTAIAALAVVTVLGGAFALVSPVAAQEVSGASVSSADPSSITFRVQVSGDPISEATLNYQRFNPEGNIGGSVVAQVPSRGTGEVVAELPTNNGTTYIPVGTRFTYSWTLRTEDGDTVQTEPEEVVFLDGRFQWQTLQEGDVTVYWYADAALAQSVLGASAGAVEDMASLLDVDIDFPITVVLYAGGDDGIPAQRPRGGVYDEMSRTGGTRVAPDLVHVYDSLGLGWEDITRHEITHVVTSAAGDGAFTSIPSWLDEGLATYAQANKGTRVNAVESAIQRDDTLRLRNLTAPTNRAELIELFYGQSWSTVEYLIDTYGAEKMADLLATIKEGNTTDQALNEVYGFDQDGLYNEWRVSKGLQPIEYEPVAEATTTARPEGTRAPLTLPTSVAAGGSTSGGSTGTSEGGGSGDSVDATAGDGGNSNAMTAAIIGVVTIALAGGLGFVGLRMLRSKPSGPASS
ncbi:MAG: peptidase MA family metallohydrolase [Dehalococcoidia bacterium]|nr:peptidase MA family metallohydrolase [Dehalococcoidia bacterium]